MAFQRNVASRYIRTLNCLTRIKARLSHRIRGISVQRAPILSGQISTDWFKNRSRRHGIRRSTTRRSIPPGSREQPVLPARSSAIEFPSINPNGAASRPQNVRGRSVKAPRVGGWRPRIVVSCPPASIDESSVTQRRRKMYRSVGWISPSGKGMKKGAWRIAVERIAPRRRIPLRERKREREEGGRDGETEREGPRCNKFRAGKNGTVGYERLMERRTR